MVFAKRKKNNKSKKGIFVGACVVVIIICVSGYIYLQAQQKTVDATSNNMNSLRTTVLEKTSITNSIAVSGTVYSGNSQNIYTTQNYPIKEIYVEVGDQVKSGDVLAVLDMTNLDYDIRQAEINLANSETSVVENKQNVNNSVQNAQISISTAQLNLEKQQLNYDTLKTQIENETHSELVSALNNIEKSEQNVDNAMRAVESAERAIEDANRNVEGANRSVEDAERTIEDANRSVESAERNVENAKKEVEVKTADNETNKALFEVGAITQSELNASARALDSAIASYESAVTSYESALSSREATNSSRESVIASRESVISSQKSAVSSYESAVNAHEIAISDLNNAKDAYVRTKEKLERELITAQKDIESAKLSYENAQLSLEQSKAREQTLTSTVETQQISLTKLKEQRMEAEIIATIDGTITEVNATVGATGTGASGSGSSGNTLFLIEDMNDLYVSSSIKEFRIDEVEVGQKAFITTDATDNQMFSGVLDFVAPTATETSSSTSVEFEIRIRLTETDPNLKIGMNAYANIILESKEDVYVVNYDAVTRNINGENVVYALENNTVVPIPVVTGIENDISVEISGADLRDGMILIQTASEVMPGQVIDLTTGNPSDLPNVDGGGRMMQRRMPEGGDMPSGETNDNVPRINRGDGNGAPRQGSGGGGMGRPSSTN